MAKRPYHESANGDAPTTEASNDLSRKKSKKNKRAADASTEPEPSNAAKSLDLDTEAVEAAAIAKAERKAARKAEKAAKKAEKASLESASAQPVSGGAEEEAIDEKAAKRARKEAKRAKKAAKEAEQGEEEVSQEVKTVKKSEKSKSATATEASNRASNGVSKASKTQKGSGAYSEHKSLTALPEADVQEYLTSRQITVDDPLNPKSLYRPMISFDYLPITEESQLAPFATFDAPTPIQAAAWPSLFAGRDMIGVAETGSGKTLAFGVPCIQSMRSTSGGKQIHGVRALIISPTRELASQIFDQLVVLAKPAGLYCACIYGGVPKDPQYEAMKKANIVVATPGRLNDLINEGVVKLGQVNYLVLDEADRMLEKGFEEEIRKIIGQTSTVGRQTLMFTATWPPSIRELAMTFMKDPVRITIGDNHSGELRANVRITQQVEVIDQYAKQNRLIELLKQHQSGAKKNDRILVFCLYKKEATRIEDFIGNRGFRVAGIHGDLSQQQRTASLDSFKKGDVPILVATDVAARGLDIPAVKVVINLTFPLTVEDYVHRIGRTGRAGQTGLAVTLFTEHDKALSGALINVLKGANQPVPEDLLKFGTTVKKKSHDAYGAFFKDTGDMKKATKITFD